MSTHPKNNGDDLYTYGLGPDDDTYLDGPKFKAYAALIEQIIHAVPMILVTTTRAAVPGAISTRAIHEALGSRARREWTQDALDWLDSIETVGVLPTRYRRRLGATPVFEKIPKNRSLERIFPHRVHMTGEEIKTDEHQRDQQLAEARTQ